MLPRQSRRTAWPPRPASLSRPDRSSRDPTAALAAAVVAAFAGIMMVVAPAASEPTVPFGVRVPPERTRAPSIIATRRVYTLRAVAVRRGLPGPRRQSLARRLTGRQLE